MNRNNNRKILRNLTTVILFAALSLQVFAKEDVPIAVKGILDLQEHGEDFTIISLRGEWEYNPDYHDLVPVLQDILKLFTQNIKNKSIQISANIPKGIMAYCDANLVKIIFRNLISNAIKFSHEEGIVTISFEKKDEQIIIYVEDKGVGMHPEQIKRMEKNKGIESTRGTFYEKGTGLGLPLVKELVEINKGTLGIQSKPGKGTAITFSLPGNHEI